MQLEPQARQTIRINITPLIDVVFILLMFFMLATNFERIAVLSINSAAAANVADSIPEPETLTVSIDSPDTYRVNGERLALAELKLRISRRFKLEPATAFVIVAGESSQLQQLVSLIDYFDQAGIAQLEVR